MKKTIVLLAIPALVLAMAPAAQAELVTHYKLDETSGSTTAVDASGNGNDGTMANTTSVAGSIDPTSTSAVSMPAGNLLSGVAPAADTNFTVMFWLKTSDFASAFNRIFAIGNDTTGSEAIFAQEVDGIAEGTNKYEVVFYPFTGVGEGESAVFEGFDDFLTDGWQHHAAVVDGLSLKWYVDAVEKGSGTMATNVTSSAFYILGSPSQATEGIGGSIDEVGVFDTVLSQSEIAGYMNNGIGDAPPSGSLISVK